MVFGTKQARAKAQTLKDAKKMAIAFAESVS